MATEDGAVHSSLVDCLPPTTGFVSACEVRMDKGVKVKRYLVIGRKSVVLADIVKDGDRMKAIVKKNVKFATVDCVILQKEDVRKAMFKKAEETVVLIKRKTPPDVLLNLTQDPKNTVLATSEYLVEVLGTHFASATGEEIRIEWRGKGEKPKVEADADLTRPDDASHDGDEPEENGAFSDNEQDGEQYQDERQGHDTLGRPPLGGGGGRSHSPEPRYADDNESDAHAPRKKVSISRDPQQVVYAEGARALPPRGLRARGFSTASPPPSGTPLNIWFVCAEKEEAAGQYSYNASVAHNGMPVFDQATGQRLYVSKTNRWVVGTIESMEQDGCWVASVEEHKGRMPHEMTTGWAMQEDGTWKLQPNTTATDQQHLGEGLALQSSVIRQHHSITLLSDRFSDLMAERHSGVRMRPIACDDLCSTIRKLEAQAKADIARNVVLLHPRRPGELFTELEISDIRQLLQRLALGVSEMDEKVYALEELLAVDGQSDAHTSMLNINPNSPASPLTQRRSSVDSRAGKPATSFAPLASSYSDRERRHEDDQLLWSFTLQSAQLVSFDDAVLRMTCKADVYTSNRQTLTPCAIAITDMGLYLCTLVEGKIIHQQSLDDVDSLIYFTDRRFIGLRLPTVELYIRSDAEQLVTNHMKALCPSITTSLETLEAHVTEPQLRLLLELDSPLVGQLRQEIASKQGEAERWQQLLQQVRKQTQYEMDASQQLAHERLENKIHEFRSEMAELRRRNDILHVSSNEAERRRLIAEEAASDRDAFVNYLFAALRNEAKNWSSWAKARTREEHGQMLLASTATVEKAERAAIENDESTVRADRIRAIAHPMAYFTSVRTLHSAEEGERSSIVKQWAVVSNDMVLEHSQFLTSISVDLHARFMKLKEDNIVAMTDLYAIRERLGSMEKESKEETNKVGSLLRANKVLQNALSSCRFLDIHRVRLDSTQLKEDTFRRNIEVESLAARQRVALLCARNCVISSLAGMRSRDSMRFSSPMSSPVLHPSSRFEFSSAAKNCNSALVAAASVMDQLATGFFRDDLFSHHDELDRQQAFGSGEYPVKEGWLFRADMSTWVNRFFVFENGNLMYVSPNSAARRAVVVTVDGITEVSPLVSPDEQPGGKFSSFLWEVKTISGDRVKFCSPTVVDRSEWVAVIKEAMTLHARFTGRGPAGLTEKRRRNVSSQQVSRSPHVEPRVSASPMSPVSPARRPSEHGYHTALSERARPVLRPSHQTWERPETIEPAGFFSAPSGIRIDTSLL